MAKINVGTTPIKLENLGAGNVIFQNLGPGLLYFGNEEDVSPSTGFRVEILGAYETPGMAGYLQLYVVSDQADTDMRWVNV